VLVVSQTMITADLTPSLVERRGKYLQGQHGQKASTNGDSSALEGACSVAVVGWAWLDRSASSNCNRCGDVAWCGPRSTSSPGPRLGDSRCYRADADGDRGGHGDSDISSGDSTDKKSNSGSNEMHFDVLTCLDCVKSVGKRWWEKKYRELALMLIK